MKRTPEDATKKIWNVPNALTMMRMLLIPVFIVLFIRSAQTPVLRYWSLGVFLLASFTDLLDGYIARKYNLITDFGKLMDPLADKLMVLTATLALAIDINQTWLWIALGILLFKEGYMVVGGLILLKHKIVVYSYMIGKVAHCFCIGAVVAMFFHPFYEGWFIGLDAIIIWIAVALTLCAMAFYTYDSIRKAKKLGIIGNRSDKDSIA